jgi:hypothetical protein
MFLFTIWHSSTRACADVFRGVRSNYLKKLNVLFGSSCVHVESFSLNRPGVPGNSPPPQTLTPGPNFLGNLPPWGPYFLGNMAPSSEIWPPLKIIVYSIF